MSRKMRDSGVEWIGELPHNWNLFPLKGVVENINEKNNPIKFTNVLSLTNTKGVIPYEEKGSQGNVSKEDVTQYKIAYKDTIIINSMNLKIGSVGYSNYEGCVSPVYYVLKNKKNSNIKFINYIFQSDFQKYLGKYGKGILEIREKISMYDVLHSYVPIPNILEQDKIVDYLEKKVSKIDITIENNKKSIKLLEEYKINLISQVVNNNLSDSKKIKLKFLGNLQNGISASAEKFGVGDGIFINYGDVYKNYEIPLEPEGKIDLTVNEAKVYSLNKGDVLFTRTSETIEEVGMAAVCTKDYTNSAYSGFVIRFIPLENTLYEGYSKYYFKMREHRSYFAKEMNLVTRASLSQGLLNNLTVILPEYNKQIEIAHKLDEKFYLLDQSIEIRKQIIERLEEYKKSLIYEAVTGKIEV